ncbi:WD40 repeat-like protein [Pseudovirgaria hyperparasitica]|uniref:WD40 repeat-like protein n=1 Tax=Pseudovirgaria hyperparasitica TaxID=470096 RepID=A0A6A6W9X6_9PEZI|nr:WD40 repeat-like protein [Pseudovirgaria hyperparasitica]KAF2758387.1 WD40 repeat-like protein [Pseudovirgaria hyperparasitica]
MDTRRVIDESTGPVALSVAFNASRSYFSVALDTGFQVYKSETCELDKTRDFGSGLAAAEMLGQSSILALVGGGRQPKFPQNKAVIWDDLKEKTPITLEFRSPVQRVRISRSHLVVVLLNSVNLYKLASPPQKLATFDTANNPYGLCCLGEQLMVFPGRTPGQIQLVRLSNNLVSIIPAHSSQLSALDLSADGEILATASEQGTLIRVWATTSSSKLAELRRGVEQAVIFSIAISPSNTMLAVTSDKSTLHIFDLPGAANSSSSRPTESMSGGESATDVEGPTKSKWGMLSKVPFMPRVFSDSYSFANARFEIGDEPTALAGSLRLGGSNASLPSLSGRRTPKGVIGWLSESVLVVIGAGQDARWEKFLVGPAADGTRVCWRDGWRRYLK